MAKIQAIFSIFFSHLEQELAESLLPEFARAYPPDDIGRYHNAHQFLLFLESIWTSEPPEPPYLYFGQAATAYYFFHFLILLPLLSIFERPRPLPSSISEPVLKGGGTPAGAAAKPMEKA